MTRYRNRLFTAALAALPCAVFLCLGLAANAAQTQISPSSAAEPENAEKPHGPMPAELTKSLDSKKLKEGDPVTARITAEVRTRSGDVIPRDSKLIGHVTEAKARSKGDPQAALGIVFDKITTPDGKELAIRGVIQAVAPNLSSGEQAGGVQYPGMMAGRDQGMSPGTTPPPMPNQNQAQQPSKPVLNAQSKGVVGIRNLELGDNSVLLSGGKEIRLDSGTQMIVQVEIE